VLINISALVFEFFEIAHVGIYNIFDNVFFVSLPSLKGATEDIVLKKN